MKNERYVDIFCQKLDKIFEDGHPTKAQIIDAFHKANPLSLSNAKWEAFRHPCDCDLAANQCKHRDYKEYELEQKLSACEIVLGDTQKEVYELKEVIYNLSHSIKLFIEMKGYTKAQVDIPAFVKALENYDNMYKQ